MTIRQKQKLKACLIFGGSALGAFLALIAAGRAAAAEDAVRVAAGGAAGEAADRLDRWFTKDGTEIIRTEEGTYFSDSFGSRGPYPS